jgi:hypothetical protein
MNLIQGSWRGWSMIERGVFIAAGIYLAVNCFLMVHEKSFRSEWDQVFIRASRQLVAGENIYIPPAINASSPEAVKFQATHPWTYPPFQALIALPMAWLPHFLSRLAWFGVQAVALVVLWKLSWRISGGKRLEGAELAILVLGLSAGMRYVQGTFGHEQSDILIDALLVAGCFAWQWGRDISAATMWGIAAAFKGPPLIMAPYLAWRGRWVAAVWTVGLAIALNLVPDVVHRAPQGIWLQEWYARIIKPTSGNIGQWYVDVTINQSIAGAAHRFFTTHWNIADGKLNTPYDKNVVPARDLKLLVYAIEGALLIAAAWGLGRPMRPPASPARAGLECALMFILMLLLSPMSHKTHFGILMLPGFFVARMAIERHDRIAAFAMIACVILIGILDRDFFGAAYGDLFAWYGNVMWGAVALGIACFYALAAERPNRGFFSAAPGV